MLGGGSGLGKKLVDNLCKNNTDYALINKSRIKERKNLFTFKLDLSNKTSRLYNGTALKTQNIIFDTLCEMKKLLGILVMGLFWTGIAQAQQITFEKCFSTKGRSSRDRTLSKFVDIELMCGESKVKILKPEWI